MRGVINLDITHSTVRIVINGRDIQFTSVRTSEWNHGPVKDLIASTKQREDELFQFLWSQVPVTIEMYFFQGSDLMRLAKITGINETIAGEHIYYFLWN